MPSTLPKLRIFVSSPGDVGAERAVAVAVTERLQLEFRGQVELETYLWERSVLRATDTFQAQIIDIAEVDLALFILWSRIGTPLPVTLFARPDGSAYLSGTEYEFERARAGHEASGRPEILCYLKTAPVQFSLRDRDERARRNAELDGVGAFVDRWFRNPDGTFKSAFYSFEKTAAFEELVEIHLRDWVRERLRALEVAPRARSVWQGSPFRGLQAFDFEHSLIYCGRTAMVAEALDMFRRRAADGRPFLMVTGMSGVGKSSLVRAGLLPLLTRPSVVEGVIGWRRAFFKPSNSHQGLGDSFAAALLAPDALPDLAAPTLAPALLDDPAALTSAIIRSLDTSTALAREARPDPEADGAVRLVVLVDQFEEVFDETVSAAERDAFCDTIRTLLLTGRVWVVATLRADFFSRLADLPERFRDLFIERGGLFTVGGPRPAEIAQMIRRPAAMAGLEFERRGDPEEGLDEVLRDAAGGNPTVLPLLEFTLDELWRRSAGSGMLRFADYEAIGGLHGALRLRADEELARLPPAVQASLPQILAAIVHTDPSDDRRILQNRVSTAQFDDHPHCRRLIEAFTAAHLLVGDVAPDGTPVVGLAHEALLREWPPAVRWIEANRETLRLRAGISAAAALWRNSENKEGRLLSGELLKDAAKLAGTNGAMLAPDERSFIRQSQRAERAQTLKQVRRAVVATALVLLAIAVPVIGVGPLVYGAAIVSTVPRVWEARPTLPVSARTREYLGRSIALLTGELRRYMDSDPDESAWVMGQVHAAAHGLPVPLGLDNLRGYMTETRDPRCWCWRETAGRGPNEVATAWVVSALALHGHPLDPHELEALLERQNRDGWWPIYPSLPVAQNASTVVTALVAVGLKRHLERDLVPPEHRARVAEAVARAVAWLDGMAQPGTARWTPYPPPPVGTFHAGEYYAVSALAAHVLRRVTGTTRFDRPWLADLPADVPTTRDLEQSRAVIVVAESNKRRVTETDDLRVYRLPWMLLATVEAAPLGSVLERARALIWVEDAFREPLSPDLFGGEVWTIAEVLFALRAVEARLNGRPFEPAPRGGNPSAGALSSAR